MATDRSNFLLKRIIEPLVEQHGFEDFHLAIESTRRALCLGQLQNVREVEVMLIGNFDVSVPWAH